MYRIRVYDNKVDEKGRNILKFEFDTNKKPDSFFYQYKEDLYTVFEVPGANAFELTKVCGIDMLPSIRDLG